MENHLKIDHIFICSDAPDDDAQIFTDFGFTEGPPNTHPGQGTANRRFFFDNMYLEFLYIADDKLAQSALTKPSKLYERFTDKGDNISPFGFGLYPSNNLMKIKDYNSWEYRPKFLPPPLKMNVYGDSLAEPMYYYMEFVSENSKIGQKKFNHANGFHYISAVKIFTPQAELDSDFKRDLSHYDILKFEDSQTHILEVTFDGGKSNKTHDFRPRLPIIFRW